MQARANQSYERLNPLAHNCNWYDILIRVIQSAFHCDINHESYKFSQEMCLKSKSELIQNTEVDFLIKLSRSLKSEIEKKRKKRLEKKNQEDSTRELNPIEEIQEKYEPLQVEIENETNSEEKLKPNVTKNERLIALETIQSIQEKTKKFVKKREEISENVTGEIGKLATQMIEETKIQNLENSTGSESDYLLNDNSHDDNLNQEIKMDDIDESITFIKEQILKNTGINREEVGEYAVQLGLTCAGVGKLSVSIMCLKLGAVLLPSTAGVALPAAAALSLLTTPMFIFSILTLAAGAIKLGFGSSEGRLVVPVISILNQRLVLAIEDINIDDYY